MPAITYSDFSGGLDRRLDIKVQEANRLWLLRNAFITLGKRVRKRPGLKKEADGLTGSYGLETISGRLKVFVDRGAAFVPPAIIDRIELDVPPSAPGQSLTRVHYGDIFQGFPYVVAEYTSGVIAHHYVDANPTTYIVDTNCPNTISVTKAASRVFAIGGEVVRYCAAGNPRDWTAADDAGFLPVSLQQDNKSSCTAVGTFQDSLVVFFSESAQIWNVAVDPAANAISKRIFGVGTSAPLSLAGFASDLMFLSPFGFRSMTVQSISDRIDDTDVGTPVDTLVQPDLATIEAQPDPEEPFGIWIQQLGQYWCVLDVGAYSKVWAYTFSKSSKIACWSEYVFGIRIKAITTLNGRVYLRTDDALYSFDPESYTDDGALVNVEVQMAFQDAKSPGVAKQVYGADMVLQGSPDISYKYDPRDQAKETIPQTISNDTRPGDLVPVEVVAPAIAPVFRHSLDEAFEIDALSLYYNLLGLV